VDSWLLTDVGRGGWFRFPADPSKYKALRLTDEGSLYPVLDSQLGHPIREANLSSVGTRAHQQMLT
jgi:hypothetical protein